MAKKLTITVDDEVYDYLHSGIGRRRLSRFLSDLAKQHVSELELEDGYKAMAANEEYEREALEWIEGIIEGAADNPR